MNKVRSYFVSLVLLGVLCLVVEQLAYCLLVPGYFFQLMVSPVFWGSFSVVCFSTLRWLDSDTDSLQQACFVIDPEPEEYDPVLQDVLSFGNPDNFFSRI